MEPPYSRCRHQHCKFSLIHLMFTNQRIETSNDLLQRVILYWHDFGWNFRSRESTHSPVMYFCLVKCKCVIVLLLGSLFWLKHKQNTICLSTRTVISISLCQLTSYYFYDDENFWEVLVKYWWIFSLLPKESLCQNISYPAKLHGRLIFDRTL